MPIVREELASYEKKVLLGLPDIQVGEKRMSWMAGAQAMFLAMLTEVVKPLGSTLPPVTLAVFESINEEFKTWEKELDSSRHTPGHA